MINWMGPLFDSHHVGDLCGFGGLGVDNGGTKNQVAKGAWSIGNSGVRLILIGWSRRSVFYWHMYDKIPIFLFQEITGI